MVNLPELLKLLRTRWVTVAVTTMVAVLLSVIVTLLTTPVYAASTRLYVSTGAGSSLSEVYQGNRLSKERVVSYKELLMGETLAQRTIDKLGLDMSASQLKKNVSATVKNDTVLITVKVRDTSPVRARDIANTLSDELVGMVRELETPERNGRPEARVVVEQRASVPEGPVTPNVRRNLLFGFAAGIALGIGLAFVRDRLDNTIKDRETLEEITGSSVVGSIPFDKDRRREATIDFSHDNSPIAEAFRKLRTNLQFVAVDNPPKAIVVSSSVPSEGKSTVAINTALALAEADHKVVLVDGDLRRPMVHKYLGLVGEVGLSTVLSGTATLEDSIQETKFPGLSVLASGAIPPNPSELLGSLVAQKVLAELRTDFDYVIVDSPPLLAVTDAAVLAASADGILIISRFANTKRDQLTHAVSNLVDIGARPLGSVFTMVPTRGTSSYAYAYKYYGEGPGDDKAANSRSDKELKAAR